MHDGALDLEHHRHVELAAGGARLGPIPDMAPVLDLVEPVITCRESGSPTSEAAFQNGS